jgi:eukaryotic-like serine/threonine-protein kinase
VQVQPEPGVVIAGRYRLLAPLGRGGMGVVWQAEHLSLRSAVAIKLMNERAAAGSVAGERFLREARAVAALASPHVVQIVDFGVEGDTPYLVMEMLQGETLAARLRRQGRLEPQLLLQVVTEVARALQRAHQAGVVHRDLKPDNVFLVRDIEHEVVKVLDFGVAKVSTQDTPQLTQSGAVLGTPHYMSPEQARGRREVDHRTDLWALAIIAYECVTGRRPFESDVLGDLLVKICTESVSPPSSVAPVPAGFDAWFARATERQPDARFQSALEMADAFRALCAPPASLPPPSLSTALPGAVSARGAAVTPPVRRGSGAGVVVVGLVLAGTLLLGLGAVVVGLLAFRGAGFAQLLGDSGHASPEPITSAAPPATSEPADAAPPSSSVVARAAPTPKGKSGAAAPPTPSPTATSTAKATPTSAAAPTSNPCIPACAKLKTCAPTVRCNPSEPCIGGRYTLAVCVNSKTCATVLECL